MYIKVFLYISVSTIILAFINGLVYQSFLFKLYLPQALVICYQKNKRKKMNTKVFCGILMCDDASLNRARRPISMRTHTETHGSTFCE